MYVLKYSFDKKEEEEKEKAPVRNQGSLIACMGAYARCVHMYMCVYTDIFIYNLGLAVLLMAGSWKN